MNDLRILRDRQWVGRNAIDTRLGRDDALGSSAMLAQTVAVSSYPSSASVFYAVVPCDVDGGETEGDAATYVARTGSVTYAINLGPQVPPEGTMVICHAVGGRWCFRYDG